MADSFFTLLSRSFPDRDFNFISLRSWLLRNISKFHHFAAIHWLFNLESDLWNLVSRSILLKIIVLIGNIFLSFNENSRRKRSGFYRGMRPLESSNDHESNRTRRRDKDCQLDAKKFLRCLEFTRINKNCLKLRLGTDKLMRFILPSLYFRNVVNFKREEKIRMEVLKKKEEKMAETTE